MSQPVIDVHAHLLPESAWTIPRGDGEVRIADRDGELFLGDVSIALDGPSLADPKKMLRDMDRCGIDFRVVSVPPYAFPLDANAADADAYCRSTTQAMVEVCGAAPDRLLPFGLIPMQTVEVAVAALERLSREPVWGVEVAAVADRRPLGEGVGREVLRTACRLGMPVLVHPVQLPRPELARDYLNNLIGNPYETAVAVASCVFGGVLEELPDLKLFFSHGGGCAAGLAGRWDHGWRRRSDVGVPGMSPPSEILRSGLYVDGITFHPSVTRLVAEVFGPDAVVLGSDYPFDMGDPDPVGSAREAGLELDVLWANALRWLGTSRPAVPGFELEASGSARLEGREPRDDPDRFTEVMPETT